MFVGWFLHIPENFLHFASCCRRREVKRIWADFPGTLKNNGNNCNWKYQNVSKRAFCWFGYSKSHFLPHKRPIPVPSPWRFTISSFFKKYEIGRVSMQASAAYHIIGFSRNIAKSQNIVSISFVNKTVKYRIFTKTSHKSNAKIAFLNYKTSKSLFCTFRKKVIFLNTSTKIFSCLICVH